MFRKGTQLKKSRIIQFLEWVGEAAIYLSIFAILPSLISGVGISVALSALLLSGVSALSGQAKYAVATAIIVTTNIFFISILTTEWHRLGDTQLKRYILFIGISYIIVLIFYGIGFYYRKCREGRVKSSNT